MYVVTFTLISNLATVQCTVRRRRQLSKTTLPTFDSMQNINLKISCVSYQGPNSSYGRATIFGLGGRGFDSPLCQGISFKNQNFLLRSKEIKSLSRHRKVLYLEVFRAFKFLSDKSQQTWKNSRPNWHTTGRRPAAQKWFYQLLPIKYELKLPPEVNAWSFAIQIEIQAVCHITFLKHVQYLVS